MALQGRNRSVHLDHQNDLLYTFELEVLLQEQLLKDDSFMSQEEEKHFCILASCIVEIRW